MIDIDDLENRIKYHKPNDEAITYISAMRSYALTWAKAVRLMVPEGREQALALTKIEEALMWANAGIARDPGNWADEPDPVKEP